MTTAASNAKSSIEVTVTHNPFAFFYKALAATITINGNIERKPWGKYVYDLPPGDYEVAASYPWILRECGKNSVRFTLAPGQTKKVRYCARLIRFIPGAISVA
ncbi:hypothetical protein ACQE3E_00130 [Methylomonas sp. MED-D]|uniref:hypothetical protein n=1 Tax=unclassified Methylomonas TaxID=2608980 RepID=UPI0028A3CF5D|nr:hypothetical protein [Methylomonas sp. MV1]MDT4330689.1 hypothetical protein [Methylomonas sp. MV1]